MSGDDPVMAHFVKLFADPDADDRALRKMATKHGQRAVALAALLRVTAP